ncbi:uncharacterized protein MONOS_96 [Monocercomonoides exilis]|uniref:uncharacterized protein n=1 Tax=Monocercomonoides exilis TaxID=2049356 RepID=UPI003559D5C3|nr:hypothetical protein MONOS_96 [Monocercomonoides exilis]|eukprot:MONOS_96.1-p1 / transcript=MONOS_96.1 / gene=MONOS_96 / organism=Monocercomonoides_exilis_PA203 / gene_product=unspecified product / transcript_product=unspecified product / location=Mono_scaffold00002:63952-66133(-) / protein_length=666 / sequence_SO=supercontig / SO=protein_coding / is_pseudo=false
MIFNHNPKHGGLWSSPRGLWQSMDSLLVFGCVFAMRMLFGWTFWRGVVTIGSSMVMMVYFVYIQPIYKLNGNLLMASKWCMFGCLRLFDEIANTIEGATGNWKITIVLQAVGLIAGIVVCIVLLPNICRNIRERKRTRTTAAVLPICDISVRLLQNYTKADELIRKAQISSPKIFLGFVLFCMTKENGGRTNRDNRNRTGDMNSFAFTKLLEKAEKHHELAVNAMKDFFENIIAISTDFKLIPVLLNSIVKNEDIARKSYEELITSHGLNKDILRSYARLLLDIYNEEDEAEMILSRADRIEEESANSGEIMDRMQVTAVHNTLFGSVGQRKAGTRKDSVDEGSSDRGNTCNEHVSNYVRLVRQESFEVTGSVDEGAATGKAADERFEACQSSFELLSFDGEREILSGSERQLQQTSYECRRNQRFSKKKRTKKKKNGMRIDMMIGGRNILGIHKNEMVTLKFATVLLHIVIVAALLSALAVDATMSGMNQKDLETLRNVCGLSYHSARAAAIAYDFFVYDKMYNFSDPVATDKWGPIIIPKKELMKMLKGTSDDLARMLGNVHGSTINMELWEAASIDTYLFAFTTKNETHPDGSVEEVIGTKTQIHHPSSMLEVLASVSQMTHHLFLSNISSRPRDPDYLPSIQHLVFNCPVPIMDGAKRVII